MLDSNEEKLPQKNREIYTSFDRRNDTVCVNCKTEIQRVPADMHDLSQAGRPGGRTGHTKKGSTTFRQTEETSAQRERET